MSNIAKQKTILVEDKARLLAFIKANPWRFAKTYAKFAPHEYVILGKLSDKMKKEFKWFVNFIDLNGVKAKFGKNTFTYLYLGEYKYWLDDGYNGELILNRADHDGGLKNPFQREYRKPTFVTLKPKTEEEKKQDIAWFKARTKPAQSSLL